MKTRIIQVGEVTEQAAAEQGAAAIAAGQLVGFATETVYGIAAAADNDDAMERLREVKSRPSRPFSVHLGRAADVQRYVQDIPADARKIMAKAWPGPVTLLLPTGGKLADPGLQARGLHDRLAARLVESPTDLATGGVIGLRCPQQPVAQAMLAAVEFPVVAPGANLAGKPSPRTAADVLDALDGRIDLLIDTGPTRYGKDSTIVQFAAGGWEIVRHGVYDARMIHKFLATTILFVCTGNTCRSPMAAGLARKMLAEKFHCTAAQLESKGVQLLSAGLYAFDGAPATPQAVAAAGQLGAEIDRHRSQKLTTELMNQSDMIFCMTASHVEEVQRMAPWAAAKVRRLDPDGDIADPIGGGPRDYELAARQIQRAMRHVVDCEQLWDKRLT